jgi:hypothetical protein
MKLKSYFRALLLIGGLTLSFSAAQAQKAVVDVNPAYMDPFTIVPDHTPMMNDVWEKINTLMYKVTKKGNQTVYTPHFPPELKSIENKIVELPGYLVPLNSGRNHSTFMLSVLPIMQCAFCGTNDIPPMIEIVMKKGTDVRFTEDPIRIKGRVHLNPDVTKGNAEVQIMDAELVVKK